MSVRALKDSEDSAIKLKDNSTNLTQWVSFNKSHSEYPAASELHSCDIFCSFKVDISVFPLQRMAEYSLFQSTKWQGENQLAILTTRLRLSPPPRFMKGRGAVWCFFSRQTTALQGIQLRPNLFLIFPPLSCSPLHIPLNPLPPLFPLSASSAPLQASAFTSLLFSLLSQQLLHPLTLSPRSYSQSAVPALLLLLQGWSAAVRWCSASCWQKPFVEHWGGLRLSLLHLRRGGPNHLACPFRAWRRSYGHGRGRALGGSSSWSCGGGPWMAWRRCSAVTGPSGGGWAGPWWAPSRSLLLSRLLQQSDPLPTTGPPDGQVTPGASHGTWNHRLVMLWY